jgi:hypothetical protein
MRVLKRHILQEGASCPGAGSEKAPGLSLQAIKELISKPNIKYKTDFTFFILSDFTYN